MLSWSSSLHTHGRAFDPLPHPSPLLSPYLLPLQYHFLLLFNDCNNNVMCLSLVDDCDIVDDDLAVLVGGIVVGVGLHVRSRLEVAATVRLGSSILITSQSCGTRKRKRRKRRRETERKKKKKNGRRRDTLRRPL